MNQEKITFSFGKNWQKFVSDSFNEERMNIAKSHLLFFLKLNDLKNLTFLDVGCGSGLSSLAAYRASAAKIISFDLDPMSIRATEQLKKRNGSPDNWKIFQGSILDQGLINSLPLADIVYSWGVLHHTGKMWQAIENTIKLVKPGGLLYLALYTTGPKSAYWLKVKKYYNQAGAVKKKFMVTWYVLRYTIIPKLLRGKSPIKFIKNYKHSRGMSYLTDVYDWLGGYPYEDVKIETVLNYFLNDLKWQYLNLATGEANTEYLFKKPL